MKRFFSLLSALFLVAVAGGWWLKFEHQAPTAEIGVPPGAVLGRRAALDVVARVPGQPGARRVEVELVFRDAAKQLAAKQFRAINWIGSGRNTVHIQVDADLVSLGAPEGPAQLQVFVDSFAWHFVPVRRHPVASRAVRIDLTPPRVQLITTQHNVRLGGSALALFRAGRDTVRAGIAVGDYFFPATRGYFTDPDVALAVFAVPQDLSADVRPQIEVADGAGNARAVELPCRIRTRRFRTRKLRITDEFLRRKVPRIIEANKLSAPSDLVSGFLFINGEFRRAAEARLRAITRKSVSRPLWDGAFHRQSKAAAMSSFADRRIYEYRGEVIDRQTHLGYDLASVKRDTVEATQNGVVVFAGNLGIYGNSVVLDHGLGVFSLYSHMSVVSVTPGQRVHTRDPLGQTGATGLAGGDHLHYSIMLHGIHVDPVEWWDAKWLRDHVSAKLQMFPAAAVPVPALTQQK